MVDLRLSKNDRWVMVGTVTRPDGSRVRVRKSTGCGKHEKTLALAYLAEYTRKILADEVDEPRVDVSLGVAIGHYLRKPNPPGKTDKLILVRLDRALGKRRLSSLKLFDLHEWVNRGSRQPGTIRREIVSINAMLNHGSEIGLKVPDWRLKRPVVDDERVRSLSEEERDRLIAACNPLIRTLVTFLFYTGARRGEALGLLWEDIDDVEGSVQFTTYKGRPPKKRVRRVKLVPGLRELLGKRGEGHVFFNSVGKPWGTNGNLYKHFKEACEKAGIDDFRIHDCRHTFATRMLSRGARMPQIGHLLGHKRLEMTQRYAHLEQGQLEETINLLGGIPDTVTDTFVKWLGWQSFVGPAKGVWANTHRGFESLSLRQSLKPTSTNAKTADSSPDEDKDDE